VANQALPKDKILDIAEFAIPNTWQETMVYRVLTLWYTPLTNSLSSAKDSNLLRDLTPVI